MTPIVLLLGLLAELAPAAAPTNPSACETFSRTTPAMPAVVHAWFAHSADERVVVCPQHSATAGESPAPLYIGEAALSQQGSVCSYRSHGLRLSGSGNAARLERYERSEALAMTLAGSACPTPHAPGTVAYVETYDITPAAFEQIMRLWSAAAASAAGNGGTARAPAADRTAASEAREHLEAALGPDHLLTPTVTRIVRLPGSVLRHRYALFLTVTDTAAASSARYVVYVDKALRGPYQITAFAETN